MLSVYPRVRIKDLGCIMHLTNVCLGAYILSPLEEASRDSEQNAGFVIEWLNSHEITRVTSYSVRNSLEGPASPPIPPVSSERKAVTVVGRGRGGRTSLSAILGDGLYEGAEKSFAAFKMLPIDPTRQRRTSSDSYGGPVIGVEEAEGAGSCREAVDMIVERMRSACEDSGSVTPDFVKVEDVVG